MRWPWISRDLHDEVVADLKTRLADSELERKKAQDECLRLLGGQPYNFPQSLADGSAVAQETIGAPDDEDPEAMRRQYMDYLAAARKDMLGPAMARLRGKPRKFIPQVPDVSKKEAVKSAFDQARAQINENGHPAAS